MDLPLKQQILSMKHIEISVPPTRRGAFTYETQIRSSKINRKEKTCRSSVKLGEISLLPEDGQEE